jgi:hypothetical protein
MFGTLKIFVKWCPIYEPLSSSLDHLTFTLQLCLKASNGGPKAQNQGRQTLQSSDHGLVSNCTSKPCAYLKGLPT